MTKTAGATCHARQTGGSTVFVFAAAIGGDIVGLDPVILSLAFGAKAAVGIAGVFELFAERSGNPADRAGDAQSAMGAGRVGTWSDP